MIRNHPSGPEPGRPNAAATVDPAGCTKAYLFGDSLSGAISMLTDPDTINRVGIIGTTLELVERDLAMGHTPGEPRSLHRASATREKPSASTNVARTVQPSARARYRADQRTRGDGGISPSHTTKGRD